MILQDILEPKQQAIVRKYSKRYQGHAFFYWWDISPGFLDTMDEYEAIEFVKKDSGQRCTVPIPAMKGYLIKERQTSRGSGNWGIKVLGNKQDELAFEPGIADNRWLFLPVIWQNFEQRKSMMNIWQLIANATERIERNYFQLPIDGKEDPIYRERAYCYELYHQLRCLWPTRTKYELSGEVDKEGHPLIRGNNLDRTKPDLLVHIPGDMGGNHTIIEVKPVTAKLAGIAKDLKTLTAFRRHANYQKAIYLFYGDGDIQRILTKSTTIPYVKSKMEKKALTQIKQR